MINARDKWHQWFTFSSHAFTRLTLIIAWLTKTMSQFCGSQSTNNTVAFITCPLKGIKLHLHEAFKYIYIMRHDATFDLRVRNIYSFIQIIWIVMHICSRKRCLRGNCSIYCNWAASQIKMTVGYWRVDNKGACWLTSITGGYYSGTPEWM